MSPPAPPPLNLKTSTPNANSTIANTKSSLRKWTTSSKNPDANLLLKTQSNQIKVRTSSIQVPNQKITPTYQAPTNHTPINLEAAGFAPSQIENRNSKIENFLEPCQLLPHRPLYKFMNTVGRFCFVLTSCFLLTSCKNTTPPSSQTSLRIGAAETDITPPIGYRMAGYFDERLSTGTHDPLKSKAIVLQQGK